tara:strand:- start:5089 stop:5958 length:870 start_codon:yes stop_codon:yes gene_type:complete
MMQPITEDQLSLEYYGTAVEKGQLSAKDVARYIIALDDFMNVVTKEAYGKDASLSMDVSGFRGQSFDIDFALQVVGMSSTAIFCTSSPKDLITLATDSIKACIHLAGKQPNQCTPDRNDNTVNIENSNGNTQIYHIQTLNVISDPKASNSLDTFIRDPLSKGLSTVKLKSSKYDVQTEATANDADFFKPIDFDLPLFENTITTGLTIESPSFKDGNKWKLHDGQSSFYAEITDAVFLESVDKGERFGKGDLLIVEMEIIQTKTPQGLKVEKLITKVKDHKEAPKQQGMF